jgi:RimJ/RimL family protein N-acetyltransferase
MSMRLWGLDWSKVLPWHFEDVVVEPTTLAEMLPFVAGLYPETFNVERRWLAEAMTEAKRRFSAEMDVFAFRIGETVVGVLAGHPSDWSTYYWRTAAFLPEYRGRHLMTRFAERCGEPLRALGVQRMEVDTSPANRAMVRMLSGQGYIVTSTISSERWGLSLRFAKFLDEEAERIYVTQFLDVPKTPTHERSQS